MSYKERIEFGKHFVSLWQLVTLRPKGITPFHLLMNFESQCNPFKTLVGHGLKKLELTIQPEYKIYQTLDAKNIIPYLTFLQALWHLCEKKIEQKFCVYFDEYQLSYSKSGIKKCWQTNRWTDAKIEDKSWSKIVT